MDGWGRGGDGVYTGCLPRTRERLGDISRLVFFFFWLLLFSMASSSLVIYSYVINNSIDHTSKDRHPKSKQQALSGTRVSASKNKRYNTLPSQQPPIPTTYTSPPPHSPPNPPQHNHLNTNSHLHHHLPPFSSPNFFSSLLLPHPETRHPRNSSILGLVVKLAVARTCSNILRY